MRQDLLRDGPAYFRPEDAGFMVIDHHSQCVSLSFVSAGAVSDRSRK